MRLIRGETPRGTIQLSRMWDDSLSYIFAGPLVTMATIETSTWTEARDGAQITLVSVFKPRTTLQLARQQSASRSSISQSFHLRRPIAKLQRTRSMPLALELILIKPFSLEPPTCGETLHQTERMLKLSTPEKRSIASHQFTTQLRLGTC